MQRLAQQAGVARGRRRERELDPLVEDGHRIQLGIPGQPAEGIQVGLRERMTTPEATLAHIGDGDQTATIGG